MAYTLQQANNDLANLKTKIDIELPLYKKIANQIIEDCSTLQTSGYNVLKEVEYTDGFKAATANVTSLQDIVHTYYATYSIESFPTVCFNAFRAMFKDAGVCEAGISNYYCESSDKFSSQYYQELKASFSGESSVGAGSSEL